MRRVARRVNCVLPRSDRKTDFGTLCLLSCLWMTAPMNYFVFWCGHSRDSNGYYYVTASWVPYHIYTTRCDHSAYAELGFSTPHNMILLDNHHGDRQKIKKRYPGCLAHAAIGMLYSAVAIQRQLQHIYIYIIFYSVGANRGQLLHIHFKGGIRPMRREIREKKKKKR